MAEKVKLEITLKDLKALNKEGLTAQYTTATGNEADPALTKQQLLDGILEVADPADPAAPVQKQQAAVGDTFEYKGKVYKVNSDKFKAVNIPGLGRRTALDIVADPEAQAYLVDHNCIGTVISEVTE